MTNISGPVTPAARRAEHVARLLDGDAPVRTESDLALLSLVGSLRDVPDPPVRLEAARDLRERLMAEADEVLVPTDRRLVLPDRGGRPRRRATALAAAFVLVGSSAGMAVAARGTVEGDPLYGVKRGLEAVDASTSLSQTARGRDYLSQSRTRLTEVSTLLGSDEDLSPAQEQAVRTTLERFARSAARGSDLLFTGYQRDASGDDVAAVRAFAGDAMGDLQRLSARAPAQLQDQLSQAATLLTDLDQQARVLCAACGGREPLELPGDLVTASSGYALDQLIDGGTAEASGQARGDARTDAATPSSAGPRPRLGAAGGKPPGSQRLPAGSQVPDVGSAIRSESGAGASTGTTGSTGSQQRRTAAGVVTRTVQKAPRLVKLPGSQSGAPSVIDLDKTAKAVEDVTDGLTTTTDGVLGGLTGTRQRN